MYKVHVKRTLIFLIVGLIGGLLYALLAPKVYEGRAEIIVADQPGLRTGAAGYSDDVNALLAPSARQSVRTEIGVLRSEGVFKKSLVQVAQDLSDPKLVADPEDMDKLFMMYDAIVPPSESENDPVRVVTIRAKAYDPDVAARIANKVLDVYNDTRMQSAKEAVSETLVYLDAEISSTRKELLAADKAYRDYKASHGVSDLLVGFQATKQNQEQLRLQRDQAEAGLAAVQAEAANEGEQLKHLNRTQIDSDTSQKGVLVQQLEAGLAQLKSQRLSKLNAYRPESATIKKIDAAITQSEAELAQARLNPNDRVTTKRADPVYQQIESAYKMNQARIPSLQRQVDSLNGSLARVTATVGQAPEDEKQLTELSRERDTFDMKYRRAKAASEDIRDRVKTTPKAATTLTSAVPDKLHYTPNALKFALITCLFGAIVGLLYSFSVEAMKLPVHTSWQLAELTSLPIATVVPLMPRRMLGKHLDSIRESSFRPTESFRFMASAMLAQETRPKTVMFTSVGGNVGCSSSAAQFAISLARTGVKVLLVDADLKNPRLTELFGMENKVGVGDILNRTMLPSQSADLTQATAHENLSFLPAGTEAPMSLADAATSHIQALIEELGDKADVVIVDCPPCDVLSDAARVAQFVDKVILVVSAKTTSFRAIPMAQDILTRAGAKEIDLVLTHASPNDEPFALRFSRG